MWDEYKDRKYDPVPDEMPHRKKRGKKPPKKANHAHDYEPIVIEYWNKNYAFVNGQGFVSGIDHIPGSRCKVCGRLVWGFPKGHEDQRKWFYPRKNDIITVYPDLPVVKVDDIWKLNKN